jgi:hypothetical protein
VGAGERYENRSQQREKRRESRRHNSRPAAQPVGLGPISLQRMSWKMSR